MSRWITCKRLSGVEGELKPHATISLRSEDIVAVEDFDLEGVMKACIVYIRDGSSFPIDQYRCHLLDRI